MAEYVKNDDLINIGAYATGSNSIVDAAIYLKDNIDAFLTQHIDEGFEYETTIKFLDELLSPIISGDSVKEEETDKSRSVKKRKEGGYRGKMRQEAIVHKI